MSTDNKPAATGSGEPHVCGPECFPAHFESVPTPPASQPTLTRWSFVVNESNGNPVPYINPKGSWVKYEDVTALIQEIKLGK